MKNTKKNSDRLYVIDNYNFCDRHTNKHTQTDGHHDSMTDPAQSAESVKSYSPPQKVPPAQNIGPRKLF